MLLINSVLLFTSCMITHVVTLPTIKPSVEDDRDLMGSEVSSPLHVAQCRATCLQQILTQHHQKGKGCAGDVHCSDCWRKCEVLEKLDAQAQWTKPVTKNVKTICSPSSSSCNYGCQVACGFHLQMNQPQQQSKPPVVATQSRNVLQLSPGLVQWPEEVGLSDSPLVYVLIQQLPHLKWRQVTQTTENNAIMPKTLWEKLDFGIRSVRVLVVSPNGLVGVLQPENTKVDGITTSTMSTSTTIGTQSAPTTASAEPSLEEIAKTWSKMMKVDEDYPPMKQGSSKQEPEEFTTTGRSENVEGDEEEQQQDLWELKRLSLIHQKSLVIAELTWNPIKYSGEQEYLITWELDGGGLLGHLVTAENTVSLSLWPNTRYFIKVELFEPNFEEGEQDEEEGATPSLSKSLPLIVDTSEASFPLLEKPSALSSQPFIATSTLIVVFVAVLFVVGALLLALVLRRLFSIHKSFSPEKQLLQEDTDDLSEEKNSASSPVRRPFLGSHGVAIISGGSLTSSSDLKPEKGPSFPPSSSNLSFSSQHHHQHHPHVHLVRNLPPTGGPWWHNNNSSPQRAPST